MKKLVIDLANVEKLAKLQCTDSEIASFLNISLRTFAREKKRPAVIEAIAKGRDLGRVSLRRHQWTKAEAGNVVMLIWLGKQYLGQKDRIANEHTGPDGGPVEVRALLHSLINRRAEAAGADEAAGEAE